MSLASSALKRTAILTTTRFARSTTTTPALRAITRPRNLATPKIYQQPTRNFTATANMGKEGVHNLKNKSEFDSAVKEDGLMVLDCFATWCGPCKVIAPQVVKFSDTYTDARFYKLDVDEVPDVAQELSVRAMPTFMLFKNGEKVGEVVGANPTALENAIKQHA